MRKIFRFGLAALLLPALFACTGRNSSARIDWQEGEQLAVAFLGYYDSFSAFEAAPSYVRLTRAFPQIVEAVKVQAGVGRELYLVIPRDRKAALSIHEEGAYVTDENRRTFLEDNAGKPVLLLNNYYETDTRIVWQDASGPVLDYQPRLDPRSGVLQLTAGGGVRDVSLPVPTPLEGLTSFDYGTDFDGRDLGIRLRLQAGRPVLTIRPGPLSLLGFDEADFSLNDGDNEFAGVNGLCKGVFLGTIGQDYNPVACVVMENGDVKKCTVFYAMEHGAQLSDALPDFKDVTGFEKDTLEDYQTIFALDERGGRVEIPHFIDYGLFSAADGDDTVMAELTPDWRFNLSRYSPDGSLDEVCDGSFSEQERGDGLDRFRFRMTRFASRDGDDFKVEERVRKGRFTAREVGLSYEVSLSGSDFFKSGTEFRDVRLADAEEGIEYD